MDRRIYERMILEIRAIHHAVTGEELRVDEAPREGDAEGASPATEEEIRRRFDELAATARSIPGVAFELWALGLDEGQRLDEERASSALRDESRIAAEE